MGLLFLIFTVFVVVFAASGFGYFLFNQLQGSMDVSKKLPNKKVVEIARDLGGKISIRELSDITGLSKGEARVKLYVMLSQGVFAYDYNESYEETFKLTQALPQKRNFKGTLNLNQNQPTQKDLSDGDIISLAVKSKGKLTPASLCMKAKISVDDAKEKLNELHEKGVFEIKVTDSGTVTYVINDLDLLE